MTAYHDDIVHSLEALKNGGTILYPTDTVWGIGCDATNPEAVEHIYEIKRRTVHSLLVLVNSMNMLANYVNHIPDVVRGMLDQAEKPVSIIYPKAQHLAANLLAEDGSVGIRLVKDDFCQQLIHAFGKPIVSTSANISGENTPDIFDRISEEVKTSVDYIVQWRRDDRCPATASSIVKLNEDGIFHFIRK